MIHIDTAFPLWYHTQIDTTFPMRLTMFGAYHGPARPTKQYIRSSTPTTSTGFDWFIVYKNQYHSDVA
jgi:hypothetical protein